MDGEIILVAVDASKEITDYALEWAIRNAIKPRDFLLLLAVLPANERPPTNGNQTNRSHIQKFLHCLLKRQGTRNKEASSSDKSQLVKAMKDDNMSNCINRVCQQMMHQICSAHKVVQVNRQVKIVADARMGSVATEAGELGASWVILDRRLKKEGELCLKKLNCNIILIDHAFPKILKAVSTSAAVKYDMGRHQPNPTVADMLGRIPSYVPPSNSTTRSNSPNSDTNTSESLFSQGKDQGGKSSPTMTENRQGNNFVHLDSQVFHHENRAEEMFKPRKSYSKSQPLKQVSKFDSVGELPLMSSTGSSDGKKGHIRPLLKTNSEIVNGIILNVANTAPIPSRRSIDTPRSRWKLENQKELKHTISKTDSVSGITIEGKELDRTSSIRRAMSLAIKHPHNPPPLCSICKHTAPIFGKAPVKFSYAEIEQATDRFSSENFLAEGGYGPVYKGVLPDGQVIAVKQHKTLSAQGASELCSEVEILSCAQHRNLVMLLGYCIEEEWLLIYEFACNGSLDKHLFGKDRNDAIPWQSRMKIAIGAARGLRYLHEDCRVGCIIHRDFRPNNILLTHDFEPMVGDFGLARWQIDGQTAEETRVIGSFGYLAPEYTQTGLITEKADVYAFGVVLLELLCGVKAVKLLKTSGQQFLPEWGRKLLEKKTCWEIIDPHLQNKYIEKEVQCMMYAASVCISSDPQKRPRMSEVLKILDGDIPSDMAYQYRQPKRNSLDAVKESDSSPSTDLLQPVLINFNAPGERTHRSNDDASTRSKIRFTKEVQRGWNLDQSEDSVSEEYQAHIQKE